MSASAGARIAFFSSTSLLAREIRSALERRSFQAVDVKLYDTAGEGTLAEYDGEALPVTRPDEEEILHLDIAFMCGTAVETEPYLDWPSRRGYVAIDMSGASRGRAGVPLVHTEINPDDIARRDGGGVCPPIIGAPHPISHNLSSLVAAARHLGAIRSVEAFVLRPASELGDPAIDELYQQTVSLLNLTSVSKDVLGRQIAFNVLPSSALTAGGPESFDGRLESEAAGLLGMEPGSIWIASALVALFHGHAMSVTLDFERPPDPEALTDRLASTPDLRLVEDPASFSPVDFAGDESVAFVGPKVDRGRPTRMSLWSFCDNLKGGAALNAVRIAERVADLMGGER